MNTIEDFGKLAGLILNVSKTEGLWIGKKHKNKNKKFGSIQWPNKPIKALGIYFGYDKKQCEFLNWQVKLEKLAEVLKSWKKRNLSIFGKVLVIKTLAMSQLIFNALVCENIFQLAVVTL